MTLHARRGGEKVDAYARYGTPNSFQIALHNTVSVPKIGALLYALSSAVSSRFSARSSRDRFSASPVIAYGRDPFSILAASILGMPVALELHSLPEKPMWIWAIQKLLKSPRFVGLVAITHSLQVDLADMFGINRDEILVSPDAADDPYLNSSPPADTGNSTPCIGYVGSLYAGRGVERILHFAKECPHLHFIIIGGSNDEIEELRRNSSLINVTFTGYIPHSELRAHYETLDIMIAPYKEKVSPYGNKGDISPYMSPLKIFEYISYGKPIVSTDLKVLSEIPDLDEFCLRPALGDDNMWITYLNMLAENRALRTQMGRKAYLLFKERFTWEKRATRIVQWLETQVHNKASIRQ